MKSIEESLIEFVADMHQNTMGKGMVREIVVDDDTFIRCVDELRSRTRLAFLTPLAEGGDAQQKGVVRFHGPRAPFELRTLEGGRVGHALDLLMQLLLGAWSRMRSIASEPGCFALTEWRDAGDLADEISAVVLALSGKKPKPPDEWTCDAHTGDPSKPTSPKCVHLVGHAGFHSWAIIVKCQNCGQDTDRRNGWCGRVECVMARMESEKKP